MFTKKELKLFAISVLVLTFAFAFDDGNPVFNQRLWLANFFKILIFVLIAYFIHVYVQKKYAEAINCKSEYKLWSLRRFWVGERTSFKSNVPVGVFLSLLITFISFGKGFFTALGYVDIKRSVDRLGRKWKFMLQYETAKGALLGPVANIILVIILNLLMKAGGYDFSTFITINLWIVIFNMIPIPPLAGGKVFFGSRTLYVFGVGFIALVFLLKELGLLGSIGLSAILAFVIMGVYFYKWEY